MRRRDFFTLLSGTAAAWSLAAHAQQSKMLRGLLHQSFTPMTEIVMRIAVRAT